MRITVLLFAGAREAAGSSSITIDVAESACVGDVLSELATQIPSIESLIPSCRLAVDNEYADASMGVTESNEFALIPPVSGG